MTVPTTETVSVSFWAQMLIEGQHPVMLAGPSGTGKSQQVSGILNTLDRDTYASMVVNMNFYSSSYALIGALG